MIVRALDLEGDFTFGKGKNNYLTKNPSIGQDIQTRLLSFIGDCFYDTVAGLDWFTFLGSKDQLGLNLAISSVILNTRDVTGIEQVSANLNRDTRKLTIAYRVTTTWSRLSGNFEFDLNGIA